MRLLILFLMFFSFALNGQPYDSLRWVENKGQRAYNEAHVKKEKVKSSNKRKKDLSPLIDVVFYVGTALLIILIIWLVINASRAKNSNEKTAFLTESVLELENKIHEVSLDELLAAAIQAGNYRQAVRIHFLMIIKKMSQEGLIHWRKEKTNWDYFLEIKNPKLLPEFKTSIVVFERFWYGDLEINEALYKQAVPVFTSALELSIKGE